MKGLKNILATITLVSVTMLAFGQQGPGNGRENLKFENNTLEPQTIKVAAPLAGMNDHATVKFNDNDLDPQTKKVEVSGADAKEMPLVIIDDKNLDPIFGRIEVDPKK